MKNYLNRQYNLLESKVFRYLFVFGGSGFAFIFLWIFEPYGLYNLTTIYEKILAIGLYTGIGLLLMFIQFFLLQSLVIKVYTVIKTIGWITLSFLIIGTSSSIINSYLYNNGQFNLTGYLYFQGIILSINIIPVSIFVLIHYNVTLKKRLKVASNINSTLDKRVGFQTNHKPIVLNSENKKEGFSIDIDSLIFICSVDNYIEVYFLANDTLEKQLLRYTLSGVEKDNSENSEIFRCHKSYIVNKSKIASITGNRAFEVLQCVTINNHTKWSTVFDVTNKTIYFKNEHRKEIVTLSIEDFNFDSDKSSEILDIQTATANNTMNQFRQYTTDINRDYVWKAFNPLMESGFIPVRLPDSVIEAQAKFPETLKIVDR